MTEVLVLVQTSELYDNVKPRSNPARPGRLTSGRFQLKFRDNGFSPPPPVSFIGSTRAVDESESGGPELVLLPRVERDCSCSRCVAFIVVTLTVSVGSVYAVIGILKAVKAASRALRISVVSLALTFRPARFVRAHAKPDMPATTLTRLIAVRTSW